jgi:hypothetical protein
MLSLSFSPVAEQMWLLQEAWVRYMRTVSLGIEKHVEAAAEVSEAHDSARHLRPSLPRDSFAALERLLFGRRDISKICFISGVST